MKPKVRFECIQGDITRQPDLDAVVNAANAELLTGGGVAGAIHKAAGPALERACRPLAPISVGEAVVTPAFKLPNRWVIHCLGPVFNVDKPSDRLLGNCFRNALILAEEHKMQSVGFPAISTGAFNYPLDEAAEVTASALHGMSGSLEHVKLVRMVLFSGRDLETYRRALGLMV